MADTPASRAAAAAWASIGVFIACLVFIVWRSTSDRPDLPVTMVLAALAMACAAVLHLVFVALLARRLGRRARWFVLGALLTLPVGSLVGLILYEWHTTVDQPQRHPAG